MRRRYGRTPAKRLGNVIQSYKQIKQNAPASHAAATRIDRAVVDGVDNYTGPSANNKEVPTGAKIEKIEFQLCLQNLVNVASFAWISIQHLRSGQSTIDPRAAGGNPQRNQIHLQLHRCIGQNQNVNITIPFKVPKKYQRVREGDQWVLTYESDTIFTSSLQTIYKFYR